MKMKKLVALGMTAMLVTGMITACGGNEGEGGSSESAGDETVLTVALWDEMQEKTLQKMIDMYESENEGIQIETQLTTWTEYWTKLEASVIGGDAADIMWVNVLNAENYANEGILMDLTELAEEIDVNGNYPQALVDGYVYDDKNYAIPKDYDTSAIFYNKELFDKAGVEYPTDEWTMDDYTQAAADLTAGLDEGEYATAVAYNSGQTTYQGTMYSNGGYILSEDKTTSGWDDPKTMEGLEVWYNLVAQGYSATQEQMADTTPDALFEGGKLAMFMAGNYMISTFEANEAIAGKFDVAMRPSYNGETIGVINGLGYAINAQTENEEAAKDFVAWLAGEDAMKIQGEDGTVISARNDAQAYYLDTYPELNLEVFTAGLDKAVLLDPRCVRYTELSDVQKTYLTEIWAGNMPLEEGCAKMAEESQEILDEMNAE